MSVHGIPEFPALPEDDSGWTAIDGELAMMVQNFPHRRANALSLGNYAPEMGDAEDAATEIKRRVAIIGKEALDVISKLRKLQTRIFSV